MKAQLLATLLMSAFPVPAYTDEGAEGGPIGPERGVLAATAENGFRLAPEPIATFGIKVTQLAGAGPWRLPRATQVFSLEEVNIFRFRDGFFKRIDFNLTRREGDWIVIGSDALRAGDSVATDGVRFLRMIELNTLGGEAAGHSH